MYDGLYHMFSSFSCKGERASKKRAPAVILTLQLTFAETAVKKQSDEHDSTLALCSSHCQPYLNVGAESRYDVPGCVAINKEMPSRGKCQHGLKFTFSMCCFLTDNFILTLLISAIP